MAKKGTTFDGTVELTPAPTAPKLQIDCMKGDSVNTILERAGITLEDGQTVVMHRCAVSSDLSTKVQPGDRLVITKKVNNG